MVVAGDGDPRSDSSGDPIDEQNRHERAADRRAGNQKQVGRTGARFGHSAGNRRQSQVGRTGARSGSAADRQPQPDTTRDVGRTGARFRAAGTGGPEPEEPPEPMALQANRSAAVPYPLAPRPDADDGRYEAGEDEAGWSAADWDVAGRTGGDGDGIDDVSSWVRPYTWTAGRTRTRYDLAVESLLSTSERGFRLAAESPRFEHRVVAELCGQPRSVAEIAALLSVPLGVARVLLDDMAALGIVAVHATAGTHPDQALLERVLGGLRQL